jgi:hypothetical protein
MPPLLRLAPFFGEDIDRYGWIDLMEPERVLAWPWHVLIGAESGRVSEPTTLVEFHLEDVDEGTLLTVSERPMASRRLPQLASGSRHPSP